MPSFTGKTFSNFYKNILGINQASNTGIDSTVRTVQDGDGNNTALSLGTRAVKVTNTTHNTTTAFVTTNSDDENILAVDTTNSLVKAGASQVNALTLYKEMGLYEFSPNAAGNHYPLIANRVGMQGAEALTYDDDWGNATDPPTTLDVSGLTDPENTVAVYWYLDNNITLDSVRYMTVADGTVTLSLHLFAYDIDGTTGDLSNGVVHATAASASAAAGKLLTGTLTLSTADIDADKVVVGFVENVTDTSDVSIGFNIKYHIR